MQRGYPCAAHDIDFGASWMQHPDNRGNTTIIVVNPWYAGGNGQRDGEIALLPTQIFDDSDCICDAGVDVDVADFEHGSRSAMKCEVEGKRAGYDGV